MAFKRSIAPMWIITIIGFLISISYFFDIPLLNNFKSELATWTVVLTGFSILMGLTYLLRHHVNNIVKPRSTTFEKIRSSVILGCIILTIAVGLFFEGFTASPQYIAWYKYTYVPVRLSITSLMCFYLGTSIVFRAFRLHDFKMTVFVFVFIVTMLASAPIGGVIWSGLMPLESWIVKIPNTAGGRGALMAIAISSITLSIRALLQKEAGLKEMKEAL